MMNGIAPSGRRSAPTCWESTARNDSISEKKVWKNGRRKSSTYPAAKSDGKFAGADRAQREAASADPAQLRNRSDRSLVILRDCGSRRFEDRNLVLDRRINQHDPGDVLDVAAGKESNIVPAHRVADENIRGPNVRGLQ